MRKNLPNDTDAYKITHPSQYVPGLSKLMSYAEPRAGTQQFRSSEFR